MINYRRISHFVTSVRQHLAPTSRAIYCCNVFTVLSVVNDWEAGPD